MATNGKSNGAATAPAASRSLTKANQQKLKRTQRDAEDLERRTLAYQYRLRGWTLKRIASELNISHQTVKKDLDIIQRSMAHKFEDFDPNALVAEEMKGFEDLINTAWKEYERGTNVHQRIKALDFIRSTKMDRFNMIKAAGIIKADPVEVNHKVAVGLMNWTEEVKEAASEAILQGMLNQHQLAAPVPDEFDRTNVIDINTEDSDEEEDSEIVQ